MNDQEAYQAAQDALLAWSVRAKPRLIKNRENIVFQAEAPDGGKAALRLHRPGYQSDDAIRSELWWSEALVAAGMVVPQAIRTEGNCRNGMYSPWRVAIFPVSCRRKPDTG